MPFWNRWRAGEGVGDGVLISAVTDYVSRWIGESFRVCHEQRSLAVHVDTYHVPPNDRYPCHTLVTSGMAQRPMRAPKEFRDHTHAELIMQLSPDWTFSESDSVCHSWPSAVLHVLGRLPHLTKDWYWIDHTIQLLEDGAPIAPGVPYSSILLAVPPNLPHEARWLSTGDGRLIHLLQVVPLFQSECEFARENGTQELYDLAKSKGLSMEELAITRKDRATLV